MLLFTNILSIIIIKINKKTILVIKVFLHNKHIELDNFQQQKILNKWYVLNKKIIKYLISSIWQGLNVAFWKLM